VPRPKGAKNKSWREVEAEGKFKIEKSKLMRKIAELEEAAKKKGTSK
jgi:hypothetical protein